MGCVPGSAWVVCRLPLRPQRPTVPVPEFLHQPAQLDDRQVAILLRLGVCGHAFRVLFSHLSAYRALGAFNKTPRVTPAATLQSVAQTTERCSKGRGFGWPCPFLVLPATEEERCCLNTRMSERVLSHFSRRRSEIGSHNNS